MENALKVSELKSGMLLEAKKGLAIVYNGNDSRVVRVAPDILAPGFTFYPSLLRGTWMYLGSKKAPILDRQPQKVHELFHSTAGIFFATGYIFKDLLPVPEIS